MIFATANKHKLREMRELLPALELEALPDGVELPPEDGDSFAAIALEKARAAHAATGEAAIGDDSGIEARWQIKVNVQPVCDVLLVESQRLSLRSKPGERS